MKRKSLVKPAGESPAMGAYRRVALELVGENQDAGPVKLKVISNSMAPFLQPGSTVFVTPLKSGTGVQRGDIIVFRGLDPDGGELLLTHRLIGNSADGWITKGDWRLLPDAPLNPQDVMGKVIACQRGGQRVDLTTTGWRLVNAWLGWFHLGLGSLMVIASRVRRRFGSHRDG